MGRYGSSEIKRNVLVINYGEHRNKYKKELCNLLNSIKEEYSINSKTILHFYVLLRNYGIYAEDDIDSVYEYFEDKDERFIEKLAVYLSDLKNKRKIYKALKLILKCIDNIRDFSNNGFYLDFLDDLKAECGLIAAPLYNNFIEPSIYTYNNIFKEDSSIVKQIIEHNQTSNNEHFDGDNTFEFDSYEEIKRNKAINKQIMKTVKEAVNEQKESEKNLY
ncbi:hypothetical protein [Brachyspira murdochii]|uniref:hypothetical protein n=1 Tax=Brachyspira murdochii TaxID=84378 RepID=UPI0030065995